jgi:DNA-binding transcriptional regulator YdaS (Cro superfamily)
MEETPLEEAVRLAGGQTALASALSTPERLVRQGHIWAWLNRDEKAPAEHCPAIETLTGVVVERLRPDLEWVRDENGKPTGYHVRLAA